MRATKRRPVVRLDAAGGRRARADTLAGEEPLEIRVAGLTHSVTMRTPGADFDLVAGLLVSEGVVWEAGHIESIGYGAGVDADGSPSYNVVEVRLAAGVAPPDRSLRRHVYTSSACGICGTASIEAVTRSARVRADGDGLRIRLDELLALGQRLRAGQQVFASTGGVHAAGLFAVDEEGLAALACLREDVGRHNAVDKAVGWALRLGMLPLGRTVLQVSGRASFELVQKAHMAGIPVLAAVSAPSALAVELAEDSGITLVGFSRGESVNVYAGEHRIVP